MADTGERDEYGMEPADKLFSSEAESEDEQDMDIDEGMAQLDRSYLCFRILGLANAFQLLPLAPRPWPA